MLHPTTASTSVLFSFRDLASRKVPERGREELAGSESKDADSTGQRDTGAASKTPERPQQISTSDRTTAWSSVNPDVGRSREPTWMWLGGHKQ